MRVALMVPCYADALEPETGIATLQLLRRLGIDVDYPVDQTCCSQPMVNAGFHEDAKATQAHFVDTFAGYDYIVAPSNSCVRNVRENLTAVEQTDRTREVRSRIVELVEFLHDVLQVEDFPWAEFPHKVTYHDSCSSIRFLKSSSMSELREEPYSKPLALLSRVRGIEIEQTKRPDECCGFGGTFSVLEPATSVKMGQDKVADHSSTGATHVVSGDGSCTMHLNSCARRLGLPMKFLHIAQVLNGDRG
ncbi:(Fe-S)-binding protein [Naumannella halotolerans]|uniref:L-lactate dehydrogenase complex protein LldE n=1 Tax=Naumannella halotolerans TaxID=993414 RepID=A0A4R7J8F4_9ACTN|nr:(Fe-S)-binding protein [Naumannella halotolerans]TDT32639.1 L-lactate dehydrogenase complex protein LldE [Naumannella halotolerans]